MDFTFDVTSAEEHDRLRALHEPLTQALRDLIDASIPTGVDGEPIRNAQSAIEAVTATLERDQHDRTRTEVFITPAWAREAG